MTSHDNFKGMHVKLVILAVLWVVCLSQICLPSHRTRYKVDLLLPIGFCRIFAVRFTIDNQRGKPKKRLS